MISTSASPACGPSMSTVSMVSGSPAFQATAARVCIDFLLSGFFIDLAARTQTVLPGREQRERTRNPERYGDAEVLALDSGSPLRGVRNDGVQYYGCQTASSFASE